MKMKSMSFGVIAMAVVAHLVIASLFFAEQSYAQEKSPLAKNVILMIGDGMGFNADLVGTYWRYGEANAQTYHQFPRRLACTTFAVKKEGFDAKTMTGYDPAIFWRDILGNREGTEFTTVTDSAASATAIYTAKKTLNGRMGMGVTAKPLKQYSMYAAEAGRSVGVVTTVTLSHATPGAVMAHLPSREMYDMIAREMLLDQPMAVIFGGGHPEYINGKPTDKIDYKFVGGKYVWQELKKKENFADALFIDERSDFDKLAAATPGSGQPLPKRVIGVPKSNYIAPAGSAIDEETEKTLAVTYRRDLLEEFPSLTSMSLAALNVLAQNENGFFIMIEGGAIDGANHGRNVKQLVFEHTGFSKAIDAVSQWVEKYSSWDETILVITADHETGHLWGPNTYTDKNDNGIFDAEDVFNGFNPVINKGKGQFPEVQYASGDHSNALVPVWIKGVNANKIDKYIRGNDSKAAQFWNFSGDYIDNTDFLPFLLKASGLNQ